MTDVARRYAAMIENSLDVLGFMIERSNLSAEEMKWSRLEETLRKRAVCTI
jgi:hypothetical protein